MKLPIILISISILFSQDYGNYFNHAELYNEKSIEKSNSFSARGNVAITDYSGGLNYVYPLFKKKVSDRFDLNVSMIYNSNLSAVSINQFGHFNSQSAKGIIFRSPMTFASSGSSLIGTSGSSNISVPGWVLNVNGVAVQLFNFNNRFFTYKNNNSVYTSGRRVQRMFNGWQYQFIKEEYRTSSGANHYAYKIQILNGDGGIDVFQLDAKAIYLGQKIRVSHLNSPILVDINRKGIIAKLFSSVTAAADGEGDLYDRMLLIYPNGNKLVFKIDYDNYLNGSDRPKIGAVHDYIHPTLYPVLMNSPDNDLIEFIYEKPKYSLHPALTYIRVLNNEGYSVSVKYLENSINVIEKSHKGFDFNNRTISRSYVFNYLETVLAESIDDLSNRHGLFKSIIDPLKNKTELSYEAFSRKHQGLTHDYGNFSTYFSAKFADKVEHNLKRLKSIKEVSGRVHEFDYYNSSAAYLNVGELAQSSENMTAEYLSSGREPHHSVMVSEHRIKDSESGPLKEKTVYNYSSNLNTVHSSMGNGSKRLPNENSRLYTEKAYYNDLNQVVRSSRFEYRQYQVVDYGIDNILKMLSDPASSEIKLLKKLDYTGSIADGTLILDERYSYETGTSVRTAYPAMPVYNGMLYQKKVETYNYKDGKSIYSWKRNHKNYHKISAPSGANNYVSQILKSEASMNFLGDSSYVEYESLYLPDSFQDILNLKYDSRDYHRAVAVQKKINTRTNRESVSINEHHIRYPLEATMINLGNFNIYQRHLSSKSRKVNNSGENGLENMAFNSESSSIEDPGLTEENNNDFVKSATYDQVKANYDNAWLSFLSQGRVPVRTYRLNEFVNFDYSEWTQHSDYYIKNDNKFYRMAASNPDTIPADSIFTINGVPFPIAYQRKSGNDYHLEEPAVFKTFERIAIYSGRSEANFIDSAYVIPNYDWKETNLIGFHAKFSNTVNSGYLNGNKLEFEFDYNSSGKYSGSFYYKILDASSYGTAITNQNVRTLFSTMTSLAVSNNNDKFKIEISALSPTDLSNLENHGIIVIPPHDLLTNSNGLWIVSTNKKDVIKTDNLQKYYAGKSFDFLNANFMNDSLVNSATVYTPGKVLKSYSFELDGNNLTKNQLVTAMIRYNSKRLPYKVQDLKGNMNEFQHSSSISRKFFDNDKYLKSESYQIKGSNFANTRMKKPLPTGAELNFYVDFHPVTGKPEHVYNDYGLAVSYSYDELNRIERISAPKFYREGSYKIIKDNYTSPLFNYYEQRITKEPDEIYVTKHGVYSFASSKRMKAGAYKRDNVVYRKYYDSENYNPPKLVVDEIRTTDYYHSYGNIKLNNPFLNDKNFTQIDTIFFRFRYKRASGSVLSVKVKDFYGDSISYNGSNQYQTVELLDTSFKDSLKSRFEQVSFEVSPLTALHGNELFYIDSVRFEVRGLNSYGKETAVSYYVYHDDQNKLNYFKVTDQANQFGSYEHLRSDYEFDEHYRFKKAIRYNDLSRSLSNAVVRQNVYDFDNQLQYSLDADTNRTQFYYNDRRELIKTSFLEGDSTTDHGISSQQNYAYLSLAEFNSQTNYPLSPQYTDYFIRKESTDENGTVSYEYLDAKERKLVSISNANASSSSSDYAKTMYVYDSYGNLIKVIHPNALKPDNSVNDALSTHYSYDTEFFTLSWKKLADQDTIKYVYDQFGRLRYSQDGKQRAENSFSYFAYDKLDRPVYSGEADGNTVFNERFKRSNRTLNFDKDSTFETANNHLSYVQYDISPNWAASIWNQFPASLRKSNTAYMAGKETYQASRMTRSDSWNFTWAEPDIFGRTRVASDYTEGILVEHRYGYDLLDRLKEDTMKTLIVSGNQTLFTDFYDYDYDILSRLNSVKKNGVEMTAYEYTNKDQLSRLKLLNGLDSINYKYNFRNWLEQINDPANPSHFFSMKMHYWTNDMGEAGQKNGNISAIESLTKGQTRLRLGYNYDKLNRLLHSKSYGSGTNRNFRFDTAYSYDKIGNILKLLRKGVK